ncbi:MAG: DUF4831 family protein, partial [Prevotellaceae bacterium]|nr:DUF4831 family protein [Prevotellaceae bacterium]
MGKYLVAALALMLVCSPAQAQRKKKGEEEERSSKSLVRIQHVESVERVDSGSFLYALPQTVFRLTVTVERSIFTAGPYAAFAEKYLGIADVQAESATRYRIKSVQLSSCVEADTRYMYMVRPTDGDGALLNYLQLTREGLILLPEKFAPPASAGSVRPFAAALPPLFANVGVETMFREVQAPSAPGATLAADTTGDGEEEQEEVELPVTLTVQAKTQEDKAAQLAQLIFNLRKRKYELVTGEVDVAFTSNEG